MNRLQPVLLLALADGAAKNATVEEVIAAAQEHYQAAGNTPLVLLLGPLPGSVPVLPFDTPDDPGMRRAIEEYLRQARVREGTAEGREATPDQG